ncbi:MAG: nitroreductase family protein [Oscillospiraceae bacterium]
METKNYLSETIRELHKRKSTRVFEKRAVPDDIKTAILQAAMQAPTAGNQQLYTILDITDAELKKKLAVSCDNQPFIADAPIVLVFCADTKKWYDAFKAVGCEPRNPRAGDLMLAVADTVAAAQNAVTAAESVGLGSCYIGDIVERCEEHKVLLDIPKYVFPVVLLVIGWPTESQRRRNKPERAVIEHIVHENRYRVMDESELRDLFGTKCGERPYEEWMRAFCERKYNSEFSREMSRSAEKYLNEYKEE